MCRQLLCVFSDWETRNISCFAKASKQTKKKYSPLSTLRYSHRALDWRWLSWAWLKVHQRPPGGTSWKRRSSPWSHCRASRAAAWWLCCWNTQSIGLSPSCCRCLVALRERSARAPISNPLYWYQPHAKPSAPYRYHNFIFRTKNSDAVFLNSHFSMQHTWHSSADSSWPFLLPHVHTSSLYFSQIEPEQTWFNEKVTKEAFSLNNQCNLPYRTQQTGPSRVRRAYGCSQQC